MSKTVLAAATMMLAGALAPVAEAAFPGQNGRIALERDNGIFLMNSDGSGGERLPTAGAATRDPVISADGRFVAFAYNRNIHIINSDGTGERPVTSDGLNDQSPAISPDGRRIAFHRGSGDLDIFVANIDGSGVTNLTNDPEGSETDVAWSPDGSRIAYTRSGCTRGTNEGGTCVYVMNADGSNQTLLTPEETYPECPDNAPGFAHRRHSAQPTWSPDGSRIAYAGYWNTCKPSGNGGDIWVMNADGSGKYRLMDDDAVDRQPAWSPDGGSIAFVSDRVDAPNTPDADIFTVPVAGGPVAQLTNGLFTEDPDWGPVVSLKPGSCANVTDGTGTPDALDGTSAGDLLRGLAGRDVLRGLAGTDCLEGGPGNDTLDGGTGDDRLAGESGNDRLIGGTGKNVYNGGAGRDTILARNGTKETVNCGQGRDKATIDRKDRVKGCERVVRRR